MVLPEKGRLDKRLRTWQLSHEGVASTKLQRSRLGRPRFAYLHLRYRTIVFADDVRIAAPNTPSTTTKGNLGRKGLAESNVRENRNRLPGNLLAQHELKESDMTRKASAPKDDYRRNEYGGRIWGVSDEDQSTYPN